ncbi:uncharacterized protein LOC134542187 [Bacillus rossius redtenbacheri]|uniref:uncharacterized protein LOC134532390 n=1 Tax=Bacillus rossius redtenbacheri TaxID=93214 RepID=UPI002FDE0ED0
MSSSSSDEEELLLMFALSKAKRKRKWVHEINEKREVFGEFHLLCCELSSFEDRFFTYFRMSQEQFDKLHTLLEHKISKVATNWSKPIGTKERLAICLRYLATGDSHNTIAFSFRVGRTTVSSIVKEVCIEIWNVLQPLYLATPTEEVWRKSEVGFRERWNFPNCIGSIDGKHVEIKCPNKSGSSYYCYKNFFSIVLLSIVDPYYNFIVVDIGSYGRHSDSAIFENSFYRDFVDNKTILPPKPLPGTETPVPHVFVGDEGFKLQTYLMRPFPRKAVVDNIEKRSYNKRHCRARRIVENAFGILTQKWRIFFRPIECNVDTAVHVVKAACCLHNFIRANTENVTTDELELTDDITNQPTNAFSATTPLKERSSDAAHAVRNHFVNYFNYLSS